MSKQKPVKHISEKLNSQQRDAINAAVNGDYYPIIQCCMACITAENKALRAMELGVTQWSANTIEHYVNLRAYLEGHIQDDKVWDAYQTLAAKREQNGEEK